MSEGIHDCLSHGPEGCRWASELKMPGRHDAEMICTINGRIDDPRIDHCYGYEPETEASEDE